MDVQGNEASGAIVACKRYGLSILCPRAFSKTLTASTADTTLVESVAYAGPKYPIVRYFGQGGSSTQTERYQVPNILPTMVCGALYHDVFGVLVP